MKVTRSAKSYNQKDGSVRVMHIVLSLGVGGAEKLVYNIVRESDPAEVYSVVCCLDMIGPLGEQLIENGFNIYHQKRVNGIDFSLVSWLRKIIIREKIEVIHAHQYTPYFYAVLSSAFIRNILIIYTEHGRLYPDRRRLKRFVFNPLFARFTDHIISISESTKKAMITYDNFPSRKIKVVLNGVKFENIKNINISQKRRSLGLEDKSLIVGTAARLDGIKNIPMMLRAFKIVLSQIPDTFLLIAGKGPKEEELKALSSELGISNRIVFLGLRHDLPEIYQLYDVFALSSFTEGISITLLEAMAAGIPAVVTDVGGNPEVVINSKTGYLVPLSDEHAMADRILELLRDPQKRSLMGQNAAARARKHFSFNRMLSDYLQLYQGNIRS